LSDLPITAPEHVGQGACLKLPRKTGLIGVFSFIKNRFNNLKIRKKLISKIIFQKNIIVCFSTPQNKIKPEEACTEKHNKKHLFIP
jgi:hypothetical protein